MDRPYSNWQRFWAVNLAALLGWIALVSAMLMFDIGFNRYTLAKTLPGAFDFVLFFAFFGLPPAFILSWLIGAPFIWRATRHPISYRRAFRLGAQVSAVIVILSIVIGRLNGLNTYLDENSFTQLGSGATTTEIDGILTLYGWMLLLLRSAAFIVMGGCIGLAVRGIIGPGTSKRTSNG